MTDLNRQLNTANLDAIKSDGTIVSANRDGAPSTFGVTLASGTTYFFPIGSQGAPVPAEVLWLSTHFRWDNQIIVTFTFETTNFTATRSPDMRGDADVSDFDAVAGNWMQENPSTATVTGSGSGGLTATGLSLVVAGGTAGGTTINLSNLAMRRGRWKAVVGGTGGKIRCAVWGKAR